MDDLPIVAAGRMNFKALRVACPYCSRDHYHREWEKDDIQEAKFWPRDLPEHLRGLMLRYRLAIVRGRRRGARKVIPFSEGCKDLCNLTRKGLCHARTR